MASKLILEDSHNESLIQQNIKIILTKIRIFRVSINLDRVVQEKMKQKTI